MVSVIALRNYKRCSLSEQVPHWCAMMSRIGRFGKASAAPPVAEDISRRTAKNGEELSRSWAHLQNVRFASEADIALHRYEALKADIDPHREVYFLPRM